MMNDPLLFLTLSAAAVLFSISFLVTARGWHIYRMIRVEELERLYRLTGGPSRRGEGDRAVGVNRPHNPPQQATDDLWRVSGALAGLGDTWQ